MVRVTEKGGPCDLALEDLARRAIDGDRNALEDLVRALQGDIYGLAPRMLCNREDAEDATQEILVRIVTHLSQFDFRSKLKTWAYRIAVNYILDVKKSPAERLHLSFEQFAEDLTTGLSPEAPEETERSLLIEEVKVGCTFGMLQCLDRSHRLAYVLGKILDLPGPEAAEALEISPDLFRKRLQHARTAILTFTRTYCGLASDSVACSCNRQLPAESGCGAVIDPEAIPGGTRHGITGVDRDRGCDSTYIRDPGAFSEGAAMLTVKVIPLLHGPLPASFQDCIHKVLVPAGKTVASVIQHHFPSQFACAMLYHR